MEISSPLDKLIMKTLEEEKQKNLYRFLWSVRSGFIWNASDKHCLTWAPLFRWRIWSRRLTDTKLRFPSAYSATPPSYPPVSISSLLPVPPHTGRCGPRPAPHLRGGGLVSSRLFHWISLAIPALPHGRSEDFAHGCERKNSSRV